MTTRLVLLSHASTSRMRAGAFPADEPLDLAGASTAAALAGRLSAADRVWTSPALRARQTAQALGLDALVESALRDCDYGRWAGRSLVDVESEDAAALAVWLADPATAPHGGEDGMALRGRVRDWMRRQAGQRGSVLAITHPAVIRAAIVDILGAPLIAMTHIDVAPLTSIRLTCHGGHWRWRASSAEAERDPAGSAS